MYELSNGHERFFEDNEMGGICGIVQDSQCGRIDPKLLSLMVVQMRKTHQCSSSVDSWGRCVWVCATSDFFSRNSCDQGSW
ncbi:MAG: hypothetical protein R3B95_10155 [Nitrospirales bacterium]|nr:hypothetical protein [Nitrospirales bacterium]